MSDYTVKKRDSDGQLCIYATGVNLVIAEFSRGTAVDAERIKKILEAAPTAKKGTLKELVQQQCREASKVPIPILLATPAFQEAWMEFCSHRCRIANKGRIQDGRKHPWNPAAATRILKACEKMGAEKAMAGMALAIEKDWLDIHYDDTPTNRTYGKPSTNQRPATGGTNTGRYSSR